MTLSLVGTHGKDSLPESSRACVWLDEAIQLAERVKETIDG